MCITYLTNWTEHKIKSLIGRIKFTVHVVFTRLNRRSVKQNAEIRQPLKNCEEGFSPTALYWYWYILLFIALPKIEIKA